MKIDFFRPGVCMALLLAVSTANDVDGARPDGPIGDERVDAPIGHEELRAHVQALASDELRGRPMGSQESLVAARYVAGRLAAIGAEPGGDEGTFEQSIPLERVAYARAPELRLELPDGESATLAYGRDFTFQSSGGPPEARELRVALVRREGDVPEVADPDLALIMATSSLRAGKWLEARGHPKRGTGFGLLLVPKKGEAGEAATPRDVPLRPRASAHEWTRVSVRGPWGQRMVETPPTRLVLDAHAEREFVRDVNVVGVLTGAGTPERPELAQEIVLLSAHRDHIGVDQRIARSDPEADAIRNGADDDASGCAAVLEIMEALAKGPRPARTVVAIFVTGEERGMVGSKYWVAHPTQPIERVVCALNFEMLGRPDELVGGAGRVWLTGDERSDLGPGLRERGMPVVRDPRPDFNFFARSDNVSFARAGIVAQSLSTYGEHTDYHQVTDEWDTLDYGHMAAAVRVCRDAVSSVASGEWTPSWNEGEPKF